ncbi:MAG: tRNA 2-thiouridine(34) synthase MnmA [Clostridia bacterium]|nr:tRNA 2-thiouridine(34) synthase MnmA [Clostridia bacterium]
MRKGGCSMRVSIGLSGGVDSAVAAHVLLSQGHEVTAVFMRNWEEEDENGVCTAAEDHEEARRVADALGIPLYTVNFTKEYRARVFDSFIREYKAGRTPNPDVLCNTEIKFNAFLDFVLKTEADAMATGHYARTRRTADGVQLLRSADENKDQTFFLCMLTKQQLDKAIFPIGGMTKPEVRQIAQSLSLPNAMRKDSTGICFIGERDFVRFISQYVPSPPGEMVDIDSGKVMGQHTGLCHYTIGQRKGIGLGGMGSGEAWFVCEKHAPSNTLFICQGKNHPALYAQGLYTEGFSFIAGDAPGRRFRCLGRFRHRQPLFECEAEVQENGDIQVFFDADQRAVAPGQVCALYQNEVCLGGGVIAGKKIFKKI